MKIINKELSVGLSLALFLLSFFSGNYATQLFGAQTTTTELCSTCDILTPSGACPWPCPAGGLGDPHCFSGNCVNGAAAGGSPGTCRLKKIGVCDRLQCPHGNCTGGTSKCRCARTGGGGC